MPRIAFMNKMDRIGADFFPSVQSMVDRAGATLCPISCRLVVRVILRAVSI